MGFLAFNLLACAELKKFPANYVYEVDLDYGVCGKYKIIDQKRLLAQHVEDLPLSACNGMFGFSTRDIPKVMSWGRDAFEFVERECK